MPAGTRTLFNALLMLFEVLMAIFMEKTTSKGSRDSSIPPSQTDKDDSAATRPGAKGKGVKQNDARSRHSRTATTTEVAAVDACAGCGADLGDTPSRSKQRRTRIDILFEKVVHHVDAEVKDCPRCRQRTTGRFPADMPGPCNTAMASRPTRMVSLDRVCKSLKTLIDVAISPATILKFVIRLHTALERWEASAIDELLRMPALNADETSLRVDRKNHWIHVYSGGDVTVERLHRNAVARPSTTSASSPATAVSRCTTAGRRTCPTIIAATRFAARISCANCSSSSTPINTPGPGT